MVSSRKNRILALSAILLTVVFVTITSHNHTASKIAATSGGSTSTNRNIPQNVETTTKIGGIDERLIKSSEDKLKQKLKDSKEQNEKTNLEITNEQIEPAVAIKNKGKEALSSLSSSKAKDTQEKIDQTSISNKQAADDEIFDPVQELQSILALSPVVIFSKTYCGFSQRLKVLLESEYEINPAPTIVELDKHKRGKELQEYIGAKTGRKTVPNIFINGVSRGGSDELKKLHDEGKLLSSLKTWGDKNIKVSKVNAPSNSK